MIMCLLVRPAPASMAAPPKKKQKKSPSLTKQSRKLDSDSDGIEGGVEEYEISDDEQMGTESDSNVSSAGDGDGDGDDPFAKDILRESSDGGLLFTPFLSCSSGSFYTFL